MKIYCPNRSIVYRADEFYKYWYRIKPYFEPDSRLRTVIGGHSIFCTLKPEYVVEELSNEVFLRYELVSADSWFNPLLALNSNRERE